MSWFGVARAGAQLTFPIASAGRYPVTASGVPFLFVGDAIWTLEVQATNAQIDTFIQDRLAKGFNTILCQLIEHQFSSQTPAYNNVDGMAPFTTMSPTDFSVQVAAYWQRVDYMVNAAKAAGIVCILFPAYFGFSGTSEGWIAEITADTAGHLQTYGTFLANRYTQGNVIWCALGDYVPTGTERDKQWNIFSSILAVNPNAMISGHASRTNSAYSVLSVKLPFNFLNTIYAPKTGECDDLAAVELGHGYPFLLIEAGYLGDSGVALINVRRSHYTALLSGAVGAIGSNANWWPLGSTAGGGATGSVATILSTYNNTTDTQQRLWAFQLLQSYAWHRLVPVIDGTFVSSSLGTSGSAGRCCPALSIDKNFGLIYKSDTNSITVVMSVFTKTSVRARWFDPTANTFSAVSGSPFVNSGSQVILHPGNNSGGDIDWVLVLD